MVGREAIPDAMNVAKELISRKEYLLAYAILDSCYGHAEKLKYHQHSIDCLILMMHCKKDDDASLKHLRDETLKIIREKTPEKSAYYSLYWNIALIYQDKEASATDPLLKTQYDTQAKFFVKIISAGSYSALRDISIEKAPFSTSQYDQAKFKEEAEKILKLLTEKALLPYCSRLEISARSTNIMGNADKSMQYCNKLLSIKPNLTSVLEIKITILLKNINAYLQNGDDPKLISTLLEYVDIKPSAEMYITLAFAYFRSSEFDEALQAFKKARVLDKEYKQHIVSLNIVHCLFQMAETRKQYEKCANKLSSYLFHHGANGRPAIVDTMLHYFQEANIIVHHATMYAEDPGTPRKKIKPCEQQPDQSNWQIPNEVKEKTKEALKKMSFLSDKTIVSQEIDPIDEYKIDPNELFSMGGPNSSIKAYIDPRAKISEERRELYKKALATGDILASSSQGKAGIKKINYGRWEIKIREAGDRLLSTATFFSLRVNQSETDDASPGVDNSRKLNTIIRFGGKEKTHAKVKAAR